MYVHTYTRSNLVGQSKLALISAVCMHKVLWSHQFKYPKVSLVIVVSGIHPPRTTEHPRENPLPQNLMPQYVLHMYTLTCTCTYTLFCIGKSIWTK